MGSTKRDLVVRIAERTGTTHVLTKAVVQAFLNELVHQLTQGNRIELRDFGVFQIRTSPSRLARNPRTLKKIRVPARRRAVFKPGRMMREQMNGCPRR